MPLLADTPLGMPTLPPNVELVVVPDPQELGRRAADRLADLLARRPAAVLALPTGRSPLPLYEEVTRRARKGLIDLTSTTIFALDEYRGLFRHDASSCFSFLRRHLLAGVRVGRVFAFDGQAADPAAECRRYESALAEAGGLDLAVLGIGRNGHLALNEPGSPFDSRTRPVSLADETRADQAWLFDDPSRLPRGGLTMGLGTLMEARAVLLLASGAAKADILSIALTGPVTESVPASVLQRHTRVTVIAEEAAAPRL